MLDEPEGVGLPPKWDGQPATWERWESWESTLEFHLPSRELACERCGSATRPISTVGTINGKRRLLLERCTNCGLDTVLESIPNRFRFEWKAWTLGPEDYGPEGSYDTIPETLFYTPNQQPQQQPHERSRKVSHVCYAGSSGHDAF